MNTTQIINITFTAPGAPGLPLSTKLVTVDQPDAVDQFAARDDVDRILHVEILTVDPGESYDLTNGRFLNLKRTNS